MKISMEEISLLLILHRTKIINLIVPYKTEYSKYRKVDESLKCKKLYFKRPNLKPTVFVQMKFFIKWICWVQYRVYTW